MTYIDLINQKYRNSGSMVHIYIHKVMQDFYHQQSGSTKDVGMPGWPGYAAAAPA